MAPNLPYRHRVFLFLQGPHGPFFGQLARKLQEAGATVRRVGFNAGDEIFWRLKDSYIPWRGRPDDWAEGLTGILDAESVTDIVLYGDVRPVHATAVAIARARGITVHVFEEGYLRPYWVTCETGGSNGNSRLTDLGLEDIRRLRAAHPAPRPVPPAHWGAMWHHVLWGALYHGCVMFLNRSYPHFTPHRSRPVRTEFLLYLKRLVLMPVRALERRLATLRIRLGAWPYHVALLQLEHDSSFQAHSPYSRQNEFLEDVIFGFAEGAAAHHHLVLKAHPLEDGKAPLRRDIRRFAARAGLTGRVHYVDGGKLAALLDEAVSVVTVNSTAGQQALWRGLPLRVFGKAVYDKPELVSHQPVAEFFANPRRPDPDACAEFREFLLETSQLPGSFYAASGRRQILRFAPDRLLSGADPYAGTLAGTAAHPQQLSLVHMKQRA